MEFVYFFKKKDEQGFASSKNMGRSHVSSDKLELSQIQTDSWIVFCFYKYCMHKKEYSILYEK